MEKENSFLGKGWQFPPSFRGEHKEVEMTTDQEDIEKSLEILLSTDIGERFLQPGYGCSLSNLIFDAQDASIPYIEDLIRDAIIFHEPRIELEEVTVNANEVEGRLDISIGYEIVGTNTRYNYVYPFYIKEGTHIIA